MPLTVKLVSYLTLAVLNSSSLLLCKILTGRCFMEMCQPDFFPLAMILLEVGTHIFNLAVLL